MSAYGGIQLSDEVLGRLAEAIRSEAIPMIVQHDHARPLSSRCLRVAVVDLPNGYKAVEADFEVDADAWDAFQAELAVQGAPGGMSFTYSELFAELVPNDPASTKQFSLTADASHFSDDALREAGARLTEFGTVRVGRLYQFADVHTCRVVVQVVQDSGVLDPDLRAVAIGVISAGIYDTIKRLLGRRSSQPDDNAPPQVEIHLSTTPDGVSDQKLHVRAKDEVVLKDALDHFSDALDRPRGVLLWDPARRDWVEP